MNPQRIKFRAHGLATPEVSAAQMRENIRCNWPMLEAREPHNVPLAVVGGGPSAKLHIDELKSWPGDIWAINQTASWLARLGIKDRVWFFTVDPDVLMADLQYTYGVERAILSSACHPKLFQALNGKDVRMFHCRYLEGYDVEVLGGGRCSAARTPMQAAWRGYLSVTYYGCEGCFGETTHAYRNETRPNQIVIKAGGKEYITTPDLYMNTEDLASDLVEYPKALKEKSGGLLRAMIEYPDSWEVVALSESLKNRMMPEATERYFPVAA